MASPGAVASARIAGVPVAVTYSSPRRRGRTILGQVVPFGQVWRTGANAATVLHNDGAVVIGDVPLPAGAWSLWTLPTDSTVTLIVNRRSGQWGTEYNPALDFARIRMHAGRTTRVAEHFSIEVAEGPPGSGRFASRGTISSGRCLSAWRRRHPNATGGHGAGATT